MNHTAKRVLSWLLALVLCISLLPGGILTADAATVNYVTDKVGGLTVVRNWGQRGTVATFLSPMAEDFYADTGYWDLASLDGGTGTTDAPGSQLYKALAELMRSNHSHITSYDETKALYTYTDCQNNDISAISSFYSGMAIGPTWEDGGWNREHTWPNSKGLEGSDENDIIMLRPTATSENGSRGNTAYGESAGYHHPNSAADGKYDLRGDVSRIMLYVYTRWGNTANMWGTDGVLENLEMMLRWMEEDPVDTWEMGRNDATESITGTRNVFVDFPELAFLMFGQAVPEMITPSGEANDSAFAITVTVNDAAMGSVTVDGRKVIAAPQEGHYMVGYTLVSGEAVITRAGDVLVVSASTDCTIHINFAARSSAKVTYYENNTQAEETVCNAGDTITMPVYSGIVPEGYSFVGWVVGAMDATTEKPAAIYTPGSAYTVDGDTDFHSLLSRVEAGTGETGVLYGLHTGELEAGDYILVFEDGAMLAQTTSKPRLKILDVTPENGILKNPDPEIVWHIAPTADGYYTVHNANGYAAGTSVKNAATLVSSVTDYAKWKVTGTDTYDFQNLGNDRYLRRNADYGYACYTAATGGMLTLYKAISGTLYYSTYSCTHENTSEVAAVAATCTATGFTAGIRCDDCGAYISGHQVVDVLDHSWDQGVVTEEATFEDIGQKEFTCTGCGKTRTESYEKPLIDLEGTSMTLGDSLSVAFVIDVSALEEDGAYAVITKSYADGRDAVELEIPQTDWKLLEGNLYYFSFDGVAAKEMCDTLSVEVYNTYGTVITNPYTDSIRSYAMRMLGKEETIADAALRTLYVDMLNYGAAAQAHFGYDAENLANGQLTDVQKAYASSEISSTSWLVEGPGRVGTTLTLKSRITLDFIFSNEVLGTDLTGCYAIAAYTDHYGKTVEKRIETFSAYDASSTYVSVPGLAVADYAQTVTCTVYDAEGNAIAWATDSIEGYAHRMTGRLPAMVEAIVKFGASAYAYFH